MKAIILDGYVDEPACFGVPPYISPYPRYAAGALAECGFLESDISYFTIDSIRALGKSLSEQFKKADVLIIISGMTVPGKYLRGTPITAEEIRAIFRLSSGIKILGGPIRLGYSNEGGVAASSLSFLQEDVIVARKDIESYLFDYFSKGDDVFQILTDTERQMKLPAGLKKALSSFHNIPISRTSSANSKPIGAAAAKNIAPSARKHFTANLIFEKKRILSPKQSIFTTSASVVSESGGSLIFSLTKALMSADPV